MFFCWNPDCLWSGDEPEECERAAGYGSNEYLGCPNCGAPVHDEAATERAAKLEYDAGMSRKEAENAANTDNL